MAHMWRLDSLAMDATQVDKAANDMCAAVYERVKVYSRSLGSTKAMGDVMVGIAAGRIVESSQWSDSEKAEILKAVIRKVETDGWE